MLAVVTHGLLTICFCHLKNEKPAGLEYLHYGCKPPLVHGNMKPTNILLTENFRAKLSDFGISKSYPTDDKTGYLDPE